MDLFGLLASMLKRIMTAITSPFRMLIVRVQRMFNVNVISAKLIQPLTKNVRKLLRLRPSAKSDYVKVGRFLVFKQLLTLLVLAACAGVFIYFQMFAGQVDAAPVSLTEIKTDVTFRFDDIAVKEFTGIANITSFDGGIVYTGGIDRGVCKGAGLLYARDGGLVYEGAFDNNRYNGAGISYSSEGKVAYEGEFSDNLYQGAGKLYNAKGTLLYSGSFVNGLYEGDGKLYDENGSLSYEGAFAAGKSHGTGTRYYSDGTVWYKGSFFEGLFQGNGELYDKTGRLLYSGAMSGGKINYRALVSATLAEVEAAFHETPSIYYQEDGNSCFFYEKAGVAVTTDCRIKVYEWEREKENPSNGFYYMPEEGDAPVDGSDLNDGVTRYEQPDPGWATPLLAQRASLPVVPMNWVVIDPYDPNSSSRGSSSSSPDSGSGSDSSSSSESSSDASSSRSTNSSSSGSSGSSGNASESEYTSGSSEDNQPNNESGANGMPSFVTKTKQLYFEVDKDVWQPEESLDKTKVFIKRVTVIDSAFQLVEGGTPIDDDSPPGVEDCVAIDNIRMRMPTAFSDVAYEMDKQNKLFQRIWNINYADRISRRSFVEDDITYRFCYQTDSYETPAYYSISADML